MSDVDRSSYIFQRLEPYLETEEPNAKGWWDAYCPLHDDETRSAGFNFTTGVWSCRKGCGSGRLRDLVARLDARDEFDSGINERETNGHSDEEVIDFENLTSAQIVGMNAKKRRQKRPVPSEELIQQWIDRLHSDEKLLRAFQTKRGYTPETIRRFELGWSDDDRAYTLPIRAASGSLLNVRLYRIDAQATKIWSYGSVGMDASALFPESVIADHHKLVIAEGEWDAIMLLQHGIPAITGTTGAEQWQAKWNRKLKGKDLYFCYDRDLSGDKGAEKAADSVAPMARSVAICELPLPWSERHGQDVSDFFNSGKTRADFEAVMNDAKVWSVPKDGAPIEVSVRESYNPLLSGKPMAMTVTVVGKQEMQHLIPKQVAFSCKMNADDKCEYCPMKAAEGSLEYEVEPTDESILKLRDVTESVRNENLRVIIGASKCGKMSIKVRSFQSQELLTCRTSLDYAADEEGDITQRSVYNVGPYGTDANQVVRVVGTTYPDPKDQGSVFVAWSSEPVESGLDQYQIDGDEIEMLSMFRPERGKMPLTKMKEIAYDLSDNVTRIIGRPELHMAMDMVWHSAVSFEFDGQPIERGWLELLVLGDARTGKSEIATKLARHYGLGRVISCESASLPGLLGAVKPMPRGGWVLEWGAIPLNDRKLVVMDEAAGLTTDQISQLSSVRSSGRAEIIKAVTHQTHARTRLIWLSNPRDNRTGMGAYMYGVRAIQPLIGNQEDIARFDFAMTVARDDVSLEIINSRNRHPRPHLYSTAACHALVRWVWSRKKDDIIFEDKAVDAVYEAAKRMGREYIADPPLVEGQNIRTKIARLAVAIAARTFSTDRTRTKLVVEEVHVDSAVVFLNYIYGRDGFGYLEASKRIKADEATATKSMDDIKEYMYSRPGLARYLISCPNGEFRAQQMAETLNYAREEMNLVINRLMTQGMIRALDVWTYRITPHLNQVLRDIKEP